MSFYPLFTLEKNKYNIWKKSCQHSISQDREGGNSTCREIVGTLTYGWHARSQAEPSTYPIFLQKELFVRANINQQ